MSSRRARTASSLVALLTAAVGLAGAAGGSLAHASDGSGGAARLDGHAIDAFEDGPGHGRVLFAQLRRRPGAPETAPGIRRRPGPPQPVTPAPEVEVDPGAIPGPPPGVFPGDFLPVPDRWRIVEGLGVNERFYDPYNQNTLKGDRPIFGEDWFIVLTGISDTLFEPRSFPVPVGIQSGAPGRNDVFGDTEGYLFSQLLIASVSLIKGDTVFRPQDLEFRLTGAYNYNYTEADEVRFLNLDPREGTFREDDHFALLEAFADYHIRNVSERYDFDSVRVGVQPFTSDFRGFLFIDGALGVRLFGTRDNNRWQYNLGAFRRIERDINSGLPDIQDGLREDDVFVANVYRQDFPILGMTSQATVLYNRNRDDKERDANLFPARPAEVGFAELREYDVVYPGVNFDGRLGRVNLTASAYGALGENDSSLLTGEEADIRAFFVAAEPSIDFDYVRLRLSGLYASGDDDAFDDTEAGFDAIFENPLFAGADTSYWIRQGIPFIGGGFVTVNSRNGVLPSLRHSKELGQSNFVNPGLTLVGVGADVSVTPEILLTANANYLRFNHTEVLEELRQQGGIDNEIGWDLSGGVIWRPLLNQNIVLRLFGATLLAGDGFEQLFGAREDDEVFYSVLANLTLLY